MLYVVGIDVPDAFFMIDTGEKQYVFLDSREYGVLKEKNTKELIELILLDPLLKEAQQIEGDTALANKLGLYLLQQYAQKGETVQVPANFPIGMADFLRSQGVELQVVHPFYPARLKKTASEVKAIREALVRTQTAFKRIEEILRDATIVGDEIHYNGEVVTTESVKRDVEQVLLEHDMLNTDGIILSCGPHAAIPHHQGAGPWRPNTTLICDIFPRHRATGYYADMTRTYVKGKPTEEVQKMYTAVQRAQEAAIAAVKPGVTGGEVHKICVDIFAELGYESGTGERGFCHGTGHGLGLDVHEDPFMRSSYGDVLEEGHVVTVEPGLYYPEHGGVRIEDVVVVTADGNKNLTDYSKEYIIP